MNIPIIPENITVHLGRPSENTLNVTEPFQNYIKNVACSEIYPTWPTEAIKANVYAQISVTMNRIYTEYYRARGYDFDITSTPANDQKYVYGRNIFSNVSNLVDEIFNSYVRRRGQIEPLFCQFCDGVSVTCDGLSQWGTVELASQGYTAEEMLKYYYGDNAEIVRNVPVGTVKESAPPVPLKDGDVGADVETVQRRLNRISSNFPSIPKIVPQDGFYDASTAEAVKTFEEVFDSPQNGIVDESVWYQIQNVYNAVKKLSTLYSEGLSLSEISTEHVENLQEGMEGVGVLVLQYYLSYLSAYIPTIPQTTIDGSFGPLTKESVLAFQQTYGIEETGIVDRDDWDKMQNVYYGLVADIPYVYSAGKIIPYPGRILRVGLYGDDVRVLQSYLDYIAQKSDAIPRVTVDGDYGKETEKAVLAFQKVYDLPVKTGRVNALTWNAILSVYEDMYSGSVVAVGQYPGYVLS